MTSNRLARCVWCGAEFTSAARGPVARYCRPSHRKRAYEARRAKAVGDTPGEVRVAVADIEVLATGLTAVARELSSTQGSGKSTQALHACVAAAGPLWDAAGVPAPATELTSPTRGAPRRKAAPRTSKPWRVVLSPVRQDVGEAEVWTAHTTERAATTMCEQLHAIWQAHQPGPVAESRVWQVVENRAADLADPRFAERSEARADAARLRVRDDQVMYHRWEETTDEWGQQRRFARVERRDTGAGELLTSRWRRPRDAWELAEALVGVSRVGAHQYVFDMLVDACGFPPDRPLPHKATASLYGTTAGEFVDEILDPLGPTWDLPANRIRSWLVDRDLARFSTS